MQTGLIHSALKRILKAKGMTYQSLATKLGLSEASIKRTFKDESLTITRLEQICDAAGVSIKEITDLAELHSTKKACQPSFEQEEFLANDPKLFVYFYLLIRGWEPSEIVTKYQFSAREGQKILSELDSIGLIERFPGDKIRLKLGPEIDWLRNGPVRKSYEKAIKEELFDFDFGSTNDRLCFANWEVSDETSARMIKAVDAFFQSMDMLAASDKHLAKDESKSFGFLLGIRPWTYSGFIRQKIKK